jgi:hypothetical protein
LIDYTPLILYILVCWAGYETQSNRYWDQKRLFLLFLRKNFEAFLPFLPGEYCLLIWAPFLDLREMNLNMYSFLGVFTTLPLNRCKKFFWGKGSIRTPIKTPRPFFQPSWLCIKKWILILCPKLYSSGPPIKQPPPPKLKIKKLQR